MGERSVQILASFLVTAISLQVWLTSTQDDTGQAYFNLMESSVKTLASKLTDIYNTTCAPPNCLCSQDICQPIPKDSKSSCFNQTSKSNLYNCSDFFQSVLGPDDGNICTSIKVTASKSSVAYVRSTGLSGDDSPSDIQQSAICRTQQLDPTFRDISEQTVLFTTFFVGTVEGSLRSFPGREATGESKDLCLKYDARTRPWYNGAISHPNHLVILLDCGVAMSDDASTASRYGSRLVVAKLFALSMMDTVYKDNYVNVFSFGASEDDTFQTSKLVHFDSEDPQNHTELDGLKQKINSLILAESSTSPSQFATGLTNALKAFNETSNIEPTAGLLNVIVFTDGSFTGGSFSNDTSVKDVLDKVKSQNVHLFMYGINSGTSDDNLKALSNEVSGSYRNFRSTDLNNPLFSMQSYFGFLAVSHKNLHDDLPFWSPNYKDYWNMGDMVTVTMPAFNGDGSLVGVAAINIILDDLGSVDDDLRGGFDTAVQAKRIEQEANSNIANNQNTASIPLAVDDSSCKYSFEPGQNLLCAAPEVNSKEDWRQRNCCNSCGKNKSRGDRKATIRKIIGAVFGVAATFVIATAGFVVWRKRKAQAAANTGQRDSGPTVPPDSTRYNPQYPRTSWAEPL